MIYIHIYIYIFLYLQPKEHSYTYRPTNGPSTSNLNTPAISLTFNFNLQSTSLNFNVTLHSQSIKFNFGHFSANYQGYSLTFWPKIAHFHHFSIYNQNQSISILVIFRQNTKAIALLFGQKSLIFITFQSTIKINQFQFWSFVGKIPRL